MNCARKGGCNMTTGYIMLMIGIAGLIGTLIWIFIDKSHNASKMKSYNPDTILRDSAPIYNSRTSIEFNRNGGNIIPQSEQMLTNHNETEIMTNTQISNSTKTRTSRFCPKCGTPNRGGGNFCQKCGHRL